MQRARRALLALAASILVGCQPALVPLDQQAAQIEAGAGNLTLVRIAVCWEALPLAEDLDAAYAASDPALSLEITPTDSSIALDLVIAGQADLAIVGEQPGEGTLARIHAASLASFHPRLIAIDTIGIVASQDVLLDNLTTGQFAELFTGRITDWAELEAGVVGRPVLVSREAGAVTRHLIESKLLAGQSVSSAAIVAPHEQGVVAYVAEHAGAIGYASLAYADDRVKWLALDGTLPETGAIRRGEYPLTHPLVLLIHPQAAGAASRLAAYLISGKGRDLIRQRYTLP